MFVDDALGFVQRFKCCCGADRNVHFDVVRPDLDRIRPYTSKIQILTIEQLLAGKGIDYPARSQRTNITFRKAPRKDQSPENLSLLDGMPEISVTRASVAVPIRVPTRRGRR